MKNTIILLATISLTIAFPHDGGWGGIGDWGGSGGLISGMVGAGASAGASVINVEKNIGHVIKEKMGGLIGGESKEGGNVLNKIILKKVALIPEIIHAKAKLAEGVFSTIKHKSKNIDGIKKGIFHVISGVSSTTHGNSKECAKEDGSKDAGKEKSDASAQAESNAESNSNDNKGSSSASANANANASADSEKEKGSSDALASAAANANAESKSDGKSEKESSSASANADANASAKSKENGKSEASSNASATASANASAKSGNKK